MSELSPNLAALMPQPPRKRRLWPWALGAGVLVMAVGAVVVSAALTGGDAPGAEPAATEQVRLGAPCSGHGRTAIAEDETAVRCEAGQWRRPVIEVAPVASPFETATPAPTTPEPAWTPCNPEDPILGGDCADFATDSCDAAHYSNSAGSLLDAFIENKDFVDPVRLKDCPQFLPTWRKAQTGFAEGAYDVGKEIKPGTYETTAHLTGGMVTDCYWERSGANGDIIDNSFVTAAKKIRVRIRASDEFFTSRGCGNWVRV